MSGRTTTSRLVATAVTVAAAALLAGCGDERSGRDDVRAYIKALNAAHDEAAPALAETNTVYGRFARGKLKGRAAVVATRRSQATIAVLRRRVEVLPAPAPARRLRRLVLAGFDANAGMAEQTALLATYVPDQDRTLRRAQKLGQTLERRLRRGASEPAVQGRALARYATGLDAVAERMRGLRPPLVLVPARDAQMQRLRGSREIAVRLRRAVLERDAPGVVRLLDRFRQVNGRRPDKAMTKAAYRAYAEYISAIRSAEEAVAREVARLDRKLT